MQIIVRGIRLSVSQEDSDGIERAEQILKPILKKQDIKKAYILKKSVDARHGNVSLVCSAIIETEKELSDSELAKYNCSRVIESNISDEIRPGTEKSDGRPVIVGFGPCGMFAALLLAENGYRPIVIERGGNVRSRKNAVDRFYRTGQLDTESNIQFGAGGAGTFSDGKLITRINDEKCRFVLEQFVKFGAPSDILTEARPHIGTDKLLFIVENIKNRIKELGGDVLFGTRLDRIIYDDDGKKAVAVHTNNGTIKCGALMLAIGHSSRDTYEYLKKSGFDIVPKVFSVGVRAEHLQEDIDRAVYGRYAGNKKLGHAEYSLSKRVGNVGVYSFCMCPGGQVVAAASEEGGVVTNGMSNFARDGVNSNAAIAVNVFSDDPIEYQRRLERAAFAAGGGGYAAPAQLLCDFMRGRKSEGFGRVKPTYMDGNVTLCDLNTVLPKDICDMLKLGFKDFEGKLRGFSADDTLLTGVETRTSAPVRILRDENMLANRYGNIYPCGEGAGYAGGITSAAVDGLKCAVKIINRYSAIPQ